MVKCDECLVNWWFRVVWVVKRREKYPSARNAQECRRVIIIKNTVLFNMVRPVVEFTAKSADFELFQGNQSFTTSLGSER